MSFHYLQTTANLIKFPFAAIGLLIDNCAATGATLINISLLDREEEPDGRLIREEDKLGQSTMLDNMKSPDRIIQYIVIEDNGRPWSNDEFLRIMLKFETVNLLEYQITDKKAKQALAREIAKK